MMQGRGQIWIETVLYTLIGLSLIALVLSYVYPKVQESQEKIIVDQTRESMTALDEVILTVNERGPGNIKSYDFTMKKGLLIVDGEKDEIVFVIEGLENDYSEPGVPVNEGRIEILTQTGQKSSNVTLTLAYKNNGKGIDIKVHGKDEKKTYNQAPTPYRFSLSHIEKAVSEQAVQYIDLTEAREGQGIA